MTEPAAYTFFKEFEASPTSQFRVDRHYLLYAAKGAMQLEADGRRWFLPPARAALIAANHPIEITILQSMTVCSVLFAPNFTAPPPACLRVFEMSPLAREMVLECRNWGPEDGPLTEHATQLFKTLSLICWQLAENPSPASMPQGQSQTVIRALEITESKLAQPMKFEDLAAKLAITPRSLARKFNQELGMTWSQSLRRLRMIRAMEHLTTSQSQITQIAFGVGYSSLSAFNFAFREFAGRSPRSFRNSLASGSIEGQNSDQN